MRILPLIALAALAACNSSSPKPGPDPQVVASVQTSAASVTLSATASAAAITPVAMPATAGKLATGSNGLGFDLWRKLPAKGDAALSPTSISVALAMALGGAKGTTATQLAATMHLDGADASTWGDVAAALASRGGSDLRIANRFYGEKSFAFDDGYVRTTATAFRAPLEAVDFKGKSEAVRGQINGWVSEQTKQRINDLIPAGGINGDTRLTLVNAIYLLADWDVPFEKGATHEEAFSLAAGKTKPTPMMHRTDTMRSGAVDGARVVSLPYKGSSLSMTVIVPDVVDGLGAIEQSLSNEKLAKIDKALTTQRTAVSLPKFTIDPAISLSLSSALRALGASDAFDAQKADFSGIASPKATGEKLFLSEVVHKAFVKVDEKGTEAAAATAVTMRAATGMPVEAPTFDVKADRPFLFLLRDRTTGLILFMGRVTDPKAG